MTDVQPRCSREELAEDARTLAETLEDAHPDPYLKHGGRVAFHHRLEESIREIPEDGESIEAFYERFAPFVTRIRDGHTRLHAPDSFESHTDGRLPLGFRVVGTDLFVDAVYDDEQADLLGGRLAAVEGTSVDTLRERHASFASSDNAYGDSRKLAGTLEGMDALRTLFDSPKTALTVAVETTDGTMVEREVRPVDAEEAVSTLETTFEHPDTNGEPAYRFLDGGSTALLSMTDMFAYREAHELLLAVEHENGEEWGRSTYEQVVGDPVPDSYEEIVAGLPAATDVLFELVEEMAAAGTETLVVDTRDNGGGTSLLTFLLIYVLYGTDGIAAAGDGHVSIPKDSALYRDNIGKNGVVGETDNPAGFDFSDYFEMQAGNHLDSLREFADLSPTVESAFDSDEYDGYYRPENVVVVTSAATYSAGAEPAFLMSNVGASVVGVPTSQAPNVPRDLLPGELPNTGLGFTVSFRHVEFLPGEVGEVFTPDAELTPERFGALDRAGDAGIRLALTYANGELTELDG